MKEEKGQEEEASRGGGRVWSDIAMSLEHLEPPETSGEVAALISWLWTPGLQSCVNTSLWL